MLNKALHWTLVPRASELYVSCKGDTQMTTAIRYIELKSKHSDNGPAWIAAVQYSKSKKSIYFNGKLLKFLDGRGVSGNYYDIESGDEYWVSGVKKHHWNRHPWGTGKIRIEKSLMKWFDSHVTYTERFFLIPIDDFANPDKSRFTMIENRKCS